MASTTVTFELVYDPDGEFKCVRTIGEDEVLIVEIEENGHLSADWTSIAAIANGSFTRKVAEIGEAMTA